MQNHQQHVFLSARFHQFFLVMIQQCFYVHDLCVEEIIRIFLFTVPIFPPQTDNLNLSLVKNNLAILD
jgi:hypothetical protein